MEKEQVMQNTGGEESPLVDSSTTEEAPSLETTQQPGTQKEGAVEEKGDFIPKANVEGEVKRRLSEEMMPIIQQTVRELMASQQANRPVQQQPQKEEHKYKGYTKSQLENVLTHPDATEQDRLFANRGLGVIEAKEEAMNEFESRTQKAQIQSRQQAAFNELVRDYPQIYVKETGRWNEADPLFQRGMQIFHSDPRLSQFGNEGLQVALDRAFAQLTREGGFALKKKEVAINAKERQAQKLQSQAMTQGTQGAPSKETGANVKLQKLMDDYSKTQDPRVFKEIAKLKGLIPSV